MAAIKQIKVWKNDKKTEARIYVHTVDGREGCKYATGNPWHAKGSIDGDLTEEEWAEAKRIAVWDGSWHTVWESDMPGKAAAAAVAMAANPRTNQRGQHCAYCGEWLEAGSGSLFYVDPEETQGESGWLVSCLDTAGCKARRNAAKAEREAEAARRAALPIATPEQETEMWNKFFERVNYIGS